jgi:hypothetical protein
MQSPALVHSPGEPPVSALVGDVVAPAVVVPALEALVPEPVDVASALLSPAVVDPSSPSPSVFGPHAASETSSMQAQRMARS